MGISPLHPPWIHLISGRNEQDMMYCTEVGYDLLPFMHGQSL
jgi:hypothetical protein